MKIRKLGQKIARYTFCYNSVTIHFEKCNRCNSSESCYTFYVLLQLSFCPFFGKCNKSKHLILCVLCDFWWRFVTLLQKFGNFNYFKKKMKKERSGNSQILIKNTRIVRKSIIILMILINFASKNS